MRIYILLILHFIVLPLCSQTSVPNYQNRYANDKYVNDYGDLLSDSEEKKLEKIIVAFEDTTGCEVVILSIKKIDDAEDIFNFSMRVAEAWQIGKADQDNGVLIVLAVEDQTWQILTGYGSQGALTDSECKIIGEEIIKPNFRAEEYYAGLEQAVMAINIALSKEFTKDDADDISDDVSGWLLFIMLIGLFFSAILGEAIHPIAGGILGAVGTPLSILLFYPDISLYWIIGWAIIGFVIGLIAYVFFELEGGSEDSGDYSSGSSGGFGGGSFGGGGASGGW